MKRFRLYIILTFVFILFAIPQFANAETKTYALPEVGTAPDTTQVVLTADTTTNVISITGEGELPIKWGDLSDALCELFGITGNAYEKYNALKEECENYKKLEIGEKISYSDGISVINQQFLVNLTTVSVDSENNNLCTKNGGKTLYSKDEKILYLVLGTNKMETISISSKTNTIYDGAFRYSEIEKISIPSGVAWIGEKAFADCESLKRVDILGSPEICSYAFYNCDNLNEIVFHEDNEDIDDFTFDYLYDGILCFSCNLKQHPNLDNTSYFFGVAHDYISGVCYDCGQKQYDVTITMDKTEVEPGDKIRFMLKSDKSLKGYTEAYIPFHNYNVSVGNHCKTVTLKPIGTNEDFNAMVGELTIDESFLNGEFCAVGGWGDFETSVVSNIENGNYRDLSFVVSGASDDYSHPDFSDTDISLKTFDGNGNPVDPSQVPVGGKVKISIEFEDESEIAFVKMYIKNLYMENSEDFIHPFSMRLVYGEGDWGPDYEKVISLTKDSQNSKLFTAEYTIDSKTRNGEYFIGGITAVDVYGNGSELEQGPFSRDYKTDTIYDPWFTYTVINGTDDYEAPTLSSIKLNKTECYIGEKVKITVSLSDANKVDKAYVILANKYEDCLEIALSSKNGTNNFEGELYIDSNVVLELYNATLVYAMDQYENEAYIYPEDNPKLQGIGLTVKKYSGGGWYIPTDSSKTQSEEIKKEEQTEEIKKEEQAEEQKDDGKTTDKETAEKLDVAKLIKNAKFKVSTEYTHGYDYTKVKASVKKGASNINKLIDAGYTVKYVYYKSTKKDTGYKKLGTSKKKYYTNKKGSEDVMYYYKVKLLVYEGKKLVASTKLSQCGAGMRIWDPSFKVLGDA